MLPESFINEVKQSVDILNLVSKYTTLKKVGMNTYAGKCPNPEHKDNNPSFTVFTDTQTWCCYGCHCGDKYTGKDFNDTNYGSDCFAFLQWISKGEKTWYQSIMELAKEYHIPVPSDENDILYRNNLFLADSYHENLKNKKSAYNYLINRGLTDEIINDWNIGWNGKITFPLYDRFNRILGFTKRWLVMPEWCRDKYRNSKNNEIFNKSYYFYGIHKLKNECPYIYITEGAMDVILADKYKLPNIVATLGTSFTDNHVEVLQLLKKKPVFIMDGDEAGLKALNKIIEKLAQKNIYSELVILPNNMDLADLANKEKDNLVKFINENKMTYGYYKIHKIINHYYSEINKIKLEIYPELKNIYDFIPGDEKIIIKNFIEKDLKLNLEEKE